MKISDFIAKSSLILLNSIKLSSIPPLCPVIQQNGDQWIPNHIQFVFNNHGNLFKSRDFPVESTLPFKS